MKTRLLLLASLMGLQLTAHAQKYQMDVEVKGGLITSYVVNDLQDVVCKDTTTTITLSNKETVVYVNKDIASLSWTEYKGSQSGSKGSYNLDMNHSAIVTPDYSVKFLAGSITGETNLTVKKVNNAPSIISTGVDEMVVYDFTLDKQLCEGCMALCILAQDILGTGILLGNHRLGFFVNKLCCGF